MSNLLDEVQELFRYAWLHPSQFKYREMLYDARPNIPIPLFEEIGIGLAPIDADLIPRVLNKKFGFTNDDFVEYGLMKPEKMGELTLSHRWIIPIRDEYGKISSFAGRSIDDGVLSPLRAKWKSSINTQHFTRSHFLYPLDKFRYGVDYNQVLLVEGYLDSIAVSGYGYPYCLSIFGVQITDAQVQWLMDKKVVNYFILLDGDLAGVLGTLRTIIRIKSANYASNCILLDAGDKDPDQLGKEAFWDIYAKGKVIDEKHYHPLQLVNDVLSIINIDNEKHRNIMNSGGWSLILEWTDFFATAFVPDIKLQIRETFGTSVSFKKSVDLNKGYYRGK